MEIKVVFSAVLALLASVTLAVLNAVQAKPELLGGLPPWLQFVIITVIPPLAAFLGGYLKPSTTSTVSNAFPQIRDNFTRSASGFVKPTDVT